MSMPARKSFFFPIISSKIFIFASIAVLIFLGVSLSKEVARRYEISKRTEKLKAEVSRLEQENTQLSQLIEYFQSESYREREARLKLGLEKEGETLIILPNVDSEETKAEAKESSQSSESQNVKPTQKWWNYFFKK